MFWKHLKGQRDYLDIGLYKLKWLATIKNIKVIKVKDRQRETVTEWAETKTQWQLNAMCDSGLNPFTV